jgi:HSP20 family protein
MLTLRQSPFDLFERLEQQLQTAERVPAAEVRESETHYLITLELPGVAKDSIDVKASDRSLVVSAERQAAAEAEAPGPLLSEFRYGTWSRSFRFPSGIDREGLHAQYRDGLLSVSAPKAQTMTTVSVEVEG